MRSERSRELTTRTRPCGVSRMLLWLAPGVRHQRHREVDPHHAAVLVQVAFLELHGGELAVTHQRAPLVGEVAILGMRDVLHRAADELGFAVAEHAAELSIDVDEVAAKIDLRDAGCGELEGLPEPRLAFFKRRFSLLAEQELAD